ncbi:hypothetical protein ADICYQ_1133 [Cyclobacterium qasimii M12-11B]|uniref:Uncharacterized protein n=1 Tax=Cyclobacterium qasimii M12-11B TaxID=641524 RepID=S7VK94_9BACT|nr:hypothetical protein ADICYQ_1133 [Cyclobacterium qasimii M12-11B]
MILSARFKNTKSTFNSILQQIPLEEGSRGISFFQDLQVRT